MIGLYVGGVMGGEFDPKRDNCRINLHNSVILSIGNVSLTPGCRIVAIDGEFPMKVPRPKYSVLENSKLKALNLDMMPTWEDGLERYLGGIGTLREKGN